MRLFIARIQGFIKYKDLMGQLISRETQVSSKRAGVFMEYFESIVYHGHYGNRVFTYVSSEEYTELSRVFNERTSVI